MNRMFRWILAFSLVISCAGVVGLSPVQAQHRVRQDIRNDRHDIHQDQARLSNLRRLRRQAMRRHQMRRVHALDLKISALNRHILQDRGDVRQDVHHMRRRHR